jgi:hypothetical protein
VLAVTSPWRVEPGAGSAFAIYGALHAATLAVSLRIPKPLPQQALFVAAAALISMLTVRAALYALRFAAELPALAGPLVLLASTSVLGAFAYGTLIRRVLKYKCGFAALAATSLLCMAATCVGFAAGRHYRVLSSLWLAIPWWFAFSGSLWYHDTLRNSSAGRKS